MAEARRVGKFVGAWLEVRGLNAGTKHNPISSNGQSDQLGTALTSGKSGQQAELSLG